MQVNDPWQFKARMKSGEKLWGTMLTIPSPAIAEILVSQEFDWFFIDGEHGELESKQIAELLRAVGHRIACFVRVPAASEVAIKKVLDLGAQGIIVPQVNDAATARDVVNWAKYAPEGSRGVGLARAHGYGSQFKDYVANANEKISILIQAEHRKAVANIESLVQVNGIDGIQLGPFDLSASMGMMGQVDAPEVQEALDRICTTCTDAGLPIASFGVSDASLKKDIQRGVTLICAGTDSLHLGNGARHMLDRVRAE